MPDAYDIMIHVVLMRLPSASIVLLSLIVTVARALSRTDDASLALSYSVSAVVYNAVAARIIR